MWRRIRGPSARSFGDLSENSEYDEAKNEQGKLYSRMAEIEEILSNYVVIEEEPSDGSSVRLSEALRKRLSALSKTTVVS